MFLSLLISLLLVEPEIKSKTDEPIAVKVENLASGRVMLKSGMKYEGWLRGYVLNNRNKLVDWEMYAILETDV
jgi:hypothetical protein